jgi:hypothetical protein
MSKHGEFNIDSWQFQFSTGEDLSEGLVWPDMLSFDLELAALVRSCN